MSSYARTHTDDVGILHVDMDETTHPLAARTAAFDQIARYFGAKVFAAASERPGQPRRVTRWFETEIGGVHTIVTETICQCHDGLVATFDGHGDVQVSPDTLVLASA